MAAPSFHCTVVTPEGKALECDALSAVFPAYDGEMGILPHHAPLLTLVGIGLFRAKTARGETKRLYIDGGFAQVTGDKLTLLTERARKLEDLDAETAATLLEEARGMEAVDDEAVETRDRAYERARVQRRLAARG
jgi:F-type H+-transporting ATPase subunit epsilon